jgi:FtsP/CotA-like multicopper oxidase with cupredoxin domain
MNGATSLANWTGLFRSGEKVRLRFINGSAMTYFDVRIPA